jgi:hypothetical protein
MRRFAVAVLSLMVAGAACSNPLDPDTANLRGTAVQIDAATNHLSLDTGRIRCLAIMGPCYDYSVHVVGKVYLELAPGKYDQISLSDVPVGSSVLVWTDGAVMESFPAQAEGSRVVVRMQ